VSTILDWTYSGPDGSGSVGPPVPCGLCGLPTILRSPSGKAVHKICAESYIDSHPEVAPYRNRQIRTEVSLDGT
jgi:hypothetical protein